MIGAINKRKTIELERAFDNAVVLLHASRSVERSAKELLEILAQGFDCEWGTFWKVDRTILRAITIWSAPTVKATQLNADTRNRTISPSDGTAGHVWRSRKPIWTADLTTDMCLPRSLEAADAGLHGGVWFALKTDRAVYGVIELLGKDLPRATDILLAAVEDLGIRLGYLIEEFKNQPRVQQF
jgi:hypothetical protein